MPLPPRDLSALHISLNPALSDFHAAYPLSRFVPAVALFKLFKLAHEGYPLVAWLDTTGWLTLACLDDLGADHCITHALQTAVASRWDRAAISMAMTTCASPFVVPMLMPVPAPSPSPPPPPPPRPASPELSSMVVRTIQAIVRDHKSKLDVRMFEAHVARLCRLKPPAACKAIRGLGERLEADPDYSAESVAAKLRAAIAEFE